MPEREAAPREASDDPGDAEVRARWSRTAGATVRYSNAAHDAREHVPLFRSLPCLGQRRIPRDKTKPEPCSLPSFIRGRGERFLRSVWTGPFIPPNFQPRRVYGRPTSSQPPRIPLSSGAPGGSRPPLGADTLGIHDRTPGAPGFLNILFTRHPASSSSPPRVSLHCLSLYLFILHAPFSRLDSA